jgi:hypothetical protein
MEALLALTLALAEPKPAAAPERQHYCVREEVARRLDQPWTREAPQRRRKQGDAVRPLAEHPPASLRKAVYCRTDPVQAVPIRKMAPGPAEPATKP